MLALPGNLDVETFLAKHWQKEPLFMPQALAAVRPRVTRNELGWLATLDDVESRIVFTEHGDGQIRYRVEPGPFDEAYLQALPRRNWTLQVHDVEKHLPPMRRLFDNVPFIPDWRIDDLMVSFAAPGGGVGPHRDNYDVFLCQGIGTREWRYTTTAVPDDTAASEDLLLVEEFGGDFHAVTRQGDVLYLPPGVAHWGTAQRACMTYSIGMRAPPYYSDPDLGADESRPGYITPQARQRAGNHAEELGKAATEPKRWLHPEPPDQQTRDTLLREPGALQRLKLHGMARLAYDDRRLYVNGRSRRLAADDIAAIASLCARRRLDRSSAVALSEDLKRWLLAAGAFDLG